MPRPGNRSPLAIRQNHTIASTVYKKPRRGSPIRTAIDQLVQTARLSTGPDTESLPGGGRDIAAAKTGDNLSGHRAAGWRGAEAAARICWMWLPCRVSAGRSCRTRWDRERRLGPTKAKLLIGSHRTGFRRRYC